MNWTFAHSAHMSLRVGVCAMALCASTVAGAQAQGTGTNSGIVIGIVAKCVNDVEQPVKGASVSATGQSFTVSTDDNGQFALGLPPGTYTINVTSSDGNSSRPNVPVEAGVLLDVGTMDVGPAALTGCGPEETAVPTSATTATPTPSPTVEATATPSPAPPTATATPTPSDQTSPDMSATPGPDQTSPDMAPGDTTTPPDDSSAS